MAGNKNSGRRYEKPFLEALQMELAGNRGIKRLREIANKLLEAAAEGDLQAIGMLADRLDGKPIQQIDHQGDAVMTPLWVLPPEAMTETTTDIHKWSEANKPKPTDTTQH